MFPGGWLIYSQLASPLAIPDDKIFLQDACISFASDLLSDKLKIIAVSIFWRSQGDSNPQPTDRQSVALTNCAMAAKGYAGLLMRFQLSGILTSYEYL